MGRVLVFCLWGLYKMVNADDEAMKVQCIER
jgi:hypothetical protein